MSDRVSVRQAEPAEYAMVGELTVLAYRADGLAADDNGYATSLRNAAGRAVAAELWVGELDGSVAGSVTFCPPGSPYRQLAGPDEGEFRMLAVEPEARGRGVGRALVLKCFDRSRELGLGAIVLCSLPSMRAAHALYGSLGFARDPGLDWEPTPGVPLLGFRATLPL
ncbi:MAG TPA: GNAT family N-acetyltransferase [Nocardioidaceae bacterium]|nr:GNAT family N-acetyltransferase [Nocardioidaceae bacterium]